MGGQPEQMTDATTTYDKGFPAREESLHLLHPTGYRTYSDDSK